MSECKGDKSKKLMDHLDSCLSFFPCKTLSKIIVDYVLILPRFDGTGMTRTGISPSFRVSSEFLQIHLLITSNRMEVKKLSGDSIYIYITPSLSVDFKLYIRCIPSMGDYDVMIANGPYAIIQTFRNDVEVTVNTDESDERVVIINCKYILPIVTGEPTSWDVPILKSQLSYYSVLIGKLEKGQRIEIE